MQTQRDDIKSLNLEATHALGHRKVVYVWKLNGKIVLLFIIRESNKLSFFIHYFMNDV